MIIITSLRQLMLICDYPCSMVKCFVTLRLPTWFVNLWCHAVNKLNYYFFVHRRKAVACDSHTVLENNKFEFVWKHKYISIQKSKLKWGWTFAIITSRGICVWEYFRRILRCTYFSNCWCCYSEWFVLLIFRFSGGIARSRGPGRGTSSVLGEGGPDFAAVKVSKAFRSKPRGH